MTRKRRKSKELSYELEKLVGILLIAPLLPWLFPAFMEEEYPPSNEFPGWLAFLVIAWGVAAWVGIGAGSPRAFAEQVAFMGALIAIVGWGAVLLTPLRIPEGADLVLAAASTGSGLLLAVVLTRRFEMWPFNKQRVLPGADDAHVCSVVHADPEGMDAYYMPICDCGWLGADAPTPELAFHEARGHTSNVRPEIERPI